MASIFNDEALEISGESQIDIGLPHQEDNGLKDQFSLEEASINVSVDSDEPIFYNADKVKKHYMISTFSKKTNKLAKAPFEDINPTKAFYNGFRTPEERLPYWIQGMYHSVYRDLATDLDVDWDEQNTPIDLKIRVSDPNVKDDEGKSRYKLTIWVYLTTGSIAFQGPDYKEAVRKLFPILKEYVVKNAGVLQSSATMDPSENSR